MTNKTRKRLWPVSLVMAVAIVGVMAAFLMVASSPTASIEAHDNGVAGNTHCDDLDQFGQLLHDSLNDHTCADGKAATPEPTPVPNTPVPPPTATPTPAPSAHATMPTDYDLQGLDNGARLDWDEPAKVAKGAEVVGYRIHRDAYHVDANNPINMHGDAIFYPEGTAAP